LKPKLTIVSDCDFFAGCEGIIALILNSEKMNKLYDVGFMYRFSQRYEKELFVRINKRTNLSRLYLLVMNRSTLPSIVRDIFLVRVIWRGLGLLLSPLLFMFNTTIISLKFIFTARKDILYVNNGGYPASWNALITVYLGYLFGFNKILLSCNNTPPARSRCLPLRIFQSHIDRTINFAASSIIVASTLNRNYLIERRAFDANKIFIVPNGIEEDRFDAAMIEFSRAKVYTGTSKIMFGIIGVHEERKGHKVLLESVTRLNNQGFKNFKVVIEGYGPLTSNFQNFVRDNSLNSYVKFLRDTKISEVYKLIDVLVVPSTHSEDLPNIISEAMLFGVPVLGSDLAGIPFQIQHKKNGIIFPIGDDAVLAVEMVDIIENPLILNEYKQECVSTYYAKFQAETYVARLETILGEKCERIL
jgi:glycosyltransferase involved in cell wall biosynthesis